MRRVLAAEKYYCELPEHHQQLLPQFRNGLEAIRHCIDHNYEIIKLITADADKLFENRQNNIVQVSYSMFLLKLYVLVCVCAFDTQV